MVVLLLFLFERRKDIIKTDIKIDGEDFIYVDLFLQGYVKPENGKIVATPKGKALLNELK